MQEKLDQYSAVGSPLDEWDGEAWIIMYSYESTSEWVGGFPSTIQQWFVMNESGALPKIFDSKEEAQEYCNYWALIQPIIIPVAGGQAKYQSEQSLLPIIHVSKRPICSHHKPKSKELSYVAWHEWADKKMRHGACQRQCKDCGRWFFKEEMNEGGC